MADEKKRTASEKTATDGTETINGHLVVVREPTGVVFWQKGNIEFHPIGQEQEQPEDNGGAVVGESTGNGVKLMTAKIAKEDYAANGISPLAETAYTLTATIIGLRTDILLVCLPRPMNR